MSAQPDEPRPAQAGFPRGPVDDDHPVDGLDAMVLQLRGFLDDVTVALLDDAEAHKLADDLRLWRSRLAERAVPADERVFGRRRDLHGRGQTMVPRFVVEELDSTSIRGTARFGNYYSGWNGAAHGGTIPLLFDEVLGRLISVAGGPRSRTAYLNTDFRAITPIDVDVAVTARIVEREGRKAFARAEIRHGKTLCAEAEGLFVALRPGQP